MPTTPSNDSPLILALDIGSSSVRAQFFTARGAALPAPTAHVPIRLRATPDGGSEIDVDVLLTAVWRCVDREMEDAGDLADRIAGVASCTFVTNLVGVDADGRPVTPLTTYADTRAAEEAAALRADLDPAAAHARTGCYLHTSYLPARLRWYARTQPARFERVAHWRSLGAHIEAQLFGAAAVSFSVASWSGLLNRHTLTWDEELLAALPIQKHHLSALKDVDAPRRGLRAPFARRWPALRDAPWFPAVGDGAAANLGSGCATPARIALTVGTTGAVRVVVPGTPAEVPAGLWCYRVDRGRSLVGGALSGGGNIYAWMRETMRLEDRDPAQVEAALAEMAPDAHGLTVLPFWAGERSPGWADDARATLHGLSLATTPVDLLRASLEAISYRIGLIFERLRPLLPADVQVVVSGGALPASPTWLQITSDVLGRPLIISQVKEASARGAALLALEALGLHETSAPDASIDGEQITPNPANHEVYQAAMARQQALYRILGKESSPDSLQGNR
ncbi:MAG: carbohydrate kinase [Chloroflexi bacterium]|jgi:gluconokinase|nr:carbohydrate kinase [Chloroflexota bacterium]